MENKPSDDTTVQRNIDPVCGMEVTPETAACSYEYKGKKYYFCAASCRDAFTQDPQGYLRKD